MEKFCGMVGYAQTVEVTPGNWKEQITERKYYGEIHRLLSKRNTPTDSTNDNITIDSELSIVADPFAFMNFQHIKYVRYMGVCWKVTSVNPQHPRLVLTLGGIYNGEQA